MLDHLGLILLQICQTTADEDGTVRQAQLTLYNYIIPDLIARKKDDVERCISPFLSLVLLYIENALTHLSPAVRIHGLKLLRLWQQHFPSLLIKYFPKLQQNYLSLLQSTTIQRKYKDATEMTLQSLRAHLNALHHLFPKKWSLLEDVNGKSCFYFHTAERCCVPVWLDFKTARWTNDEFGRLQADSSSTRDCLLEFSKQLVPLLIRHWLEATPSHELINDTLDDVYNSNIETLVTIVDLFTVLYSCVWNSFCSSALDPSPGSLKEQLFEGHRRMLFKHIFPFFLAQQDSVQQKISEKLYYIQVKLACLFAWYLPESENKLSKGSVKAKQAVLQLVMKLLKQPSRETWFPLIRDVLFHVVPSLLDCSTQGEQQELLQSILSSYQHVSMQSKLKREYLTFFYMLIFDGQRGASFRNISKYRSIVQKWLLTLPTLICQFNASSNQIADAVLKMLFNFLRRQDMTTASQINVSQLQQSLIPFFCSFDTGKPRFGTFVHLPLHSQELAIHLLHYLGVPGRELMQSLAGCFLSNALSPIVAHEILLFVDRQAEEQLQLNFWMTTLLGILQRVESHQRCNTREEWCPASGLNLSFIHALSRRVLTRCCKSRIQAWSVMKHFENFRTSSKTGAALSMEAEDTVLRLEKTVRQYFIDN